MDELLAGGNFGRHRETAIRAPPAKLHTRWHNGRRAATRPGTRDQDHSRYFRSDRLYLGLAQTQAWRPFPSDPVQTGGLQAVVTRLLKYGSQVEGRWRHSSKPPAAPPKTRRQKACRSGESILRPGRRSDSGSGPPSAQDRRSPGPRRAPAIIFSISGAMGVKLLPWPHHFANNTLVSATEVSEEVSSATDRIWSSGTLLTRRMERTGLREAIATPGRMAKPWNAGIGGRRNDADIRRSRSQVGGALRRDGIGDIEGGARVSVLEIPHQRGSIKVGNRGNTKAFHAAIVLA